MAIGRAIGFARAAVSVRSISGQPTGVTVPGAQAANARARLGNPNVAQGNVLASQQPNTDRRRFVTHS